MSPDLNEVENQTAAPSRRFGVYILPNLFTTGSLFSGFYAIIAAVNHHEIAAAMAIFVAMMFDCLDGRVARLINAQSSFGAQYDSLSDLISFGLAPALLVYNWALNSLSWLGFDHIGWLTAFLYVTCVALRLARFNTQAETPDVDTKRYFIGLSCTAAAGASAGWVWVANSYAWEGIWVSLVSECIMIGLSILMVSTMRFRSFKDVDLRHKVPIAGLAVIVAVYMAISINPANFLFAVFGAYALSGPVLSAINYQKLCPSKSRGA